MTHFITSAILIIGALGLFVTFTKPRYEALDLRKQEIASYEDALGQVSKLQAMTAQLEAQAKLITPQEADRISKAMPQNLDNVRLILEIDVLAKNLGLNASNISIRENNPEKTEAVRSSNQDVSQESQDASISSSNESATPSLRSSVAAGAYRSVDMSFNVEASYADLKKLLKKLERSLRFIDIVSVTSSGTGEGGGSTYTVTFKTYWLGS